MTTIKEIAKLSGVSATTVSRVLNGRPDVNKETKAAVLKVIEEANYVPNANAKNLKAIASNMICVIVKGIGNPFLLSLVEEMQGHIEAAGYLPHAHYIDESADEVLVAQQLTVEKKPLGFLFLGGSAVGRRNDLRQLSVPVAFAAADAKAVGLSHVSSATVDDRLCAKKAVDALLLRGHREIMVLGGSLLAQDIVGNRHQGVKDAFFERGFVFSEAYYFECKFSLESAYRAASRMLDSGLPFTALFCMSDIMAIGAAKAIHDRGLKIPDDVSVIGFDGLELAKFYTPSLATIRQPVAQMAKISVEVLVKNIQGRSKARHEILTGELLLGQSICERYLSEEIR
jgi:Transcriptional regulators